MPLACPGKFGPKSKRRSSLGLNFKDGRSGGVIKWFFLKKEGGANQQTNWWCGKQWQARKQQQKNNLEDSAKAEVDAKIEESLTVDTGKTGDESVGSDLLEMIKDVIADGALTVSKKVKGFVMIFVYASVYPAVPFFAVMAAMLALLKYLFYKLRVF